MHGYQKGSEGHSLPTAIKIQPDLILGSIIQNKRLEMLDFFKK